MDVREFESWRLFDQYHTPIGYRLAATVCLVFCWVMGAKKAKFEDFLPHRLKLEDLGRPKADPKKQQTMAQMKSVLACFRRPSPSSESETFPSVL
jgi:hypothetical protein